MARLPDSPEGLAVDAQGRLYAVIAATGEVVRLDEKGGYEHYATVPSKELSTAGVSLGAHFDRSGNLYIAFFWLGSHFGWDDPLHLACRDSTDRFTGVYKVEAATRKVTPFVTKADGWAVCVPDDVAVDSQGNLYVTDLTLSGVWKISAERKFTLWSADPLLQWPPKPYGDLPEGVNDLVLDRAERNLFVATDGYPAVIRFPINADGSAGLPVVVARDLAPLDGIELDEAGNIYVSEPSYDRIEVLSPDGKQRGVVASDEVAPLAGPTSLVYRKGILCTTNFGDYMKAPKSGSVTCMVGFRRP
jgi:sugar lactone lactonase YvrE